MPCPFAYWEIGAGPIIFVNTIENNRCTVLSNGSQILDLLYLPAGAEPDIFIWGAIGGGQFCNKGSCQWSVWDFQKETWKILGGPLGKQGKIFGGKWPPWHPSSSAPAYLIDLLLCSIEIECQKYLPWAVFLVKWDLIGTKLSWKVGDKLPYEK